MIGIRADANEIIATGHIMRCLSIAEQLRKMDQEILFIISEEYYRWKIKESGFEVYVLHGKYNEKEKELDDLERVINDYRIETLLIDSYEVTEKYLDKLRKLVRTIYIDDLNAMYYPVDVIINYIYDATIQQYAKWKYDNRTQIYTGVSYLPLREQFVGKRKEIKKKVQSLFITVGGTDPYQFIQKLLLYLEDTGMQALEKHVVIGGFYKDEAWLQKYAEKRETIFVYKNVTDMAEIMLQCDLAISAGGTTLSELCACGIPTIAFSMADNQVPGVTAYAKEGMLLYVGDIREGIKEKVEAIEICARDLIFDLEKRKRMSKKQREVIDGMGTKRIAEII